MEQTRLPLSLEKLLEVIEGDREIVEQLQRLGIVQPLGGETYTAEEVELCCVARTLVRELEVNWPGVDIVLRLRTELLATRRQVSHLLDLLRPPPLHQQAGDLRSRPH